MKNTIRAIVIASIGIVSLQAQEIRNPSFEEPPLPPTTQFVTPISPNYEDVSKSLIWAFGMPAGICIEESAYAEKMRAADGHQVAFIQGDPSNPENSFPIKSVMGTDITGLTEGKEYELSWSQTGRASDTGTGALSVILTTGNLAPMTLIDKEPVETKGEWEKKTVRFVAPASTVRLNIVHSIAEPANPTPGSESTLLDAFKIEEVK